MQLLFICTAFLFTVVGARPTKQSRHGPLYRRAYQNYGSSKVRGGTATSFISLRPNLDSDTLDLVNLGGWGVLEPWITPSIFENVDQSLGIIDEFTLTQKLPTQAAGILNSHWSKFYSFVLLFLSDSCSRLTDFQAFAAAGINTVRIPVGTARIWYLNFRILVILFGSWRPLRPRFYSISRSSHFMGKTNWIKSLDRSPRCTWY